MHERQARVDDEVVNLDARDIGTAKEITSQPNRVDLRKHLTKWNFVHLIIMPLLTWWTLPTFWPAALLWIIPPVRPLLFGFLVYSWVPGQGQTSIFAGIAAILLSALAYPPDPPKPKPKKKK